MADSRALRVLTNFQKNEITEYHIYNYLASRSTGKNAELFSRIAADELRHYGQFKKHTGTEVKPDSLKIFFYLAVISVFGVTFGIKLMEKGEGDAQAGYEGVLDDMPEAKRIIKEEVAHEHHLLHMIDEDKMKYLDSMVLAVNNALEELTGVVVGLTFALQDSKKIGFTALITGVAAIIAMTASEYLSQKSEGTKDEKNPLKAAFYTFVVYLLTVALIVGPYFIFSDYRHALAAAIGSVVLIIFVFSYFMAVVKEISFKKSFLEVLAITALVVAISYGVGTLIRMFTHAGAGH